MKSWPDLAALDLLVAVADHGSLSAGARSVGMAQPNASRSLSRLERHLGVGLVLRSTAGSTLTPAGLLIVEWARQVLDTATRLADGAATLAHSGSAGLAVSASQTVGEHLLPTWLAVLRHHHPDCTATVRIANSAEVVADVLAGTSAVGFVEGPRPPRGVHSTVVDNDELVLVVPPEHPWSRRRRRVTAEELTGTPLLTREPGSGTRVALEEALGTPVLAAQELSSNAAIRVGVQSGGAPAVLSRLAVTEALAAGALLEVPLSGVDLSRQLRAVWTGPRRLSGLAADLVDVAQRSGPGHR
ncbi:LysR family transcriptional regulator [Nocardioides terrisoli]|uniref:LysR family transcriptional regulator n=1 Tax=Nocardioides terrisoli TaxID=3388267 RepID=UPI00287BBECC|nr:LysR family transcriptional regulator [Nocardioides marmorisolisilvae]